MRASDPELKRKRKKENRSLSWHVVDSNTAWLNAECVWHDNRVCYLTQNNSVVVPSSGVLARAQRQLYALTEKSDFRKNVDIDDWREHRLAKLEIAKLLSTITLEQPFDSIVTGAKRGSKKDLQMLCQLLIAESVIFSALPFSASKNLAALGDFACADLHALTQRKDLPSNARRLAALVLGANLKQVHDRKFSPSSFAFKEEELRRCFYWGLKNGCVSEDAFFARILQDREGLDLAGRVSAATLRLKHLNIETALACRMLSAGIETNRLVELIEGLAAMEPLYVEMYRQQFDDHQFSWNQEERRERRAFAAEWKKLFFEILLFCLDTRALVAMTSISQWILSSYKPNANHARVFRDIFNTAGFSPSLFASFLRILDVHSERIFLPFDCDLFAEMDESTRLSDCWIGSAYPIRTLLLSVQSPEVVEKVLALGTHDATLFAEVDWQDANEVKHVLRLYEKYCAELWEFPVVHKFFSRADDYTQAAQIIEQLMQLQTTLISEDDWNTTYLHKILSYFGSRKNGVKELEGLVSDVMPKFIPVTALCCGANRLEELTFIPGMITQQYAQWLLWFYEELQRQKDKDGMGCVQRDCWRAQFMLATVLSGASFDRMKALLLCLSQLVLPEGYLFHSQSMTWLGTMEALVFAFRVMFTAQSSRAISLLQNMLLIHQVCREPLNDLQSLSPNQGDWNEWLLGRVTHEGPFRPGADNAHAWSLDDAEFDCWNLVCDHNADVARLASAYFASCQPCVLPKSIVRELAYRKSLNDEKRFLESKIASGENSNERLRKRIANINKRLSDPETHLKFIANRIQEKLEFHLANQIFLRAEAIVLSAYKRRIADIIGFHPQIDSFDDDLFFAALLWLDLKSNKVLLRKLLKARMQDDTEWSLRLPANKNYLALMKERGLDVTVWLSENAVTFPASFMRGGKVRLYMERDPLKVLRMGHYFNTCLKFGGVNSFSVVTNAVDINKRVIYATDMSGNVIARKLICIADEKTLLGYNMYFPTAVDDHYEQLRVIFKQYCESIASIVGLTLGNEGAPQVLCAEDWYDDGTVDWENEETAATDAAEAIAADIYTPPAGAGNVRAGALLSTPAPNAVNPQPSGASGRGREAGNACVLQRIRNRNSSR